MNNQPGTMCRANFRGPFGTARSTGQHKLFGGVVRHDVNTLNTSWNNAMRTPILDHQVVLVAVGILSPSEEFKECIHSRCAAI